MLTLSQSCRDVCELTSNFSNNLSEDVQECSFVTPFSDMHNSLLDCNSVSGLSFYHSPFHQHGNFFL